MYDVTTACLRHLNRRMDPDFKASSADKFLVKVQAYTGFTQLINSFEVTPHHHHHDTTHSAVVISAANSHIPPYTLHPTSQVEVAEPLRRQFSETFGRLFTCVGCNVKLVDRSRLQGPGCLDQYRVCGGT